MCSVGSQIPIPRPASFQPQGWMGWQPRRQLAIGRSAHAPSHAALHGAARYRSPYCLMRTKHCSYSAAQCRALPGAERATMMTATAFKSAPEGSLSLQQMRGIVGPRSLGLWQRASSEVSAPSVDGGRQSYLPPKASWTPGTPPRNGRRLRRANQAATSTDNSSVGLPTDSGRVSVQP